MYAASATHNVNICIPACPVPIDAQMHRCTHTYTIKSNQVKCITSSSSQNCHIVKVGFYFRFIYIRTTSQASSCRAWDVVRIFGFSDPEKQRVKDFASPILSFSRYTYHNSFCRSGPHSSVCQEPKNTTPCPFFCLFLIGRVGFIIIRP